MIAVAEFVGRFGIEKGVQPDSVDITPMVIIGLLAVLFLFASGAIFEEHTLVGTAFFCIGIFLIAIIITTSVDAGVEYAKRNGVYATERVEMQNVFCETYANTEIC